MKENLGYMCCKKFSNLCKQVYEVTLREAQEVGIPDFGKSFLKDLQSDEKALASNLTYTLRDFSNKLHKDEDFQSYSYGIWIPTKLHNGELASKKDEFSCMRGEFLLPNYDLHIDFGACDGVTELIW